MSGGQDSRPGGESVAELLWGPPRRPGRGPKPGMSLARITGAAIAIADADGLHSVSMQRVATDLGFTKMALYRYVPGKAELVALMVETAVGPPPDLDESGWRDRLTQWARHLLEPFRRHPWLLQATAGPRVIGPHEAGWLESALAGLEGTSLTGAEQLDTVAVLAGHIRTIAQQTGTTDRPEESMNAGFAAQVQAHRDRYPALTAALSSVAAQGGQDEALDFGLDRILDGIGLLVAARRPGGAATTS